MQRPTLGFHLVDDCIDHQILRLLGEMQKSLYCLPNLMGQLDEVKCKLVPGIAFGFVFLADFGAVCVSLSARCKFARVASGYSMPADVGVSRRARAVLREKVGCRLWRCVRLVILMVPFPP